MKKIIDYIIINSTLERLTEEAIWGKLEEGYQPYGELKTTYDDCAINFTQAMVKYEDDDIIEG